GRYAERARRRGVRESSGFFEHVGPAPGEHDIPAGLQQQMRRRAPDAAAPAGDDRDFSLGCHLYVSPHTRPNVLIDTPTLPSPASGEGVIALIPSRLPTTPSPACGRGLGWG